MPIAEQEAGEQAAEPIAAVDEVQQWLRRTLKPKTDNVVFPQSLKDVVRIITFAHRLGVGDFVWLSWDGRMQTRRTHPSHAATAFAVTQLGARHMLNMMQQEVPPSHIDVLFRDRLIQNYWNGHLRCSYVCKPLGGYIGHRSGVEEEHRPHNFDRPWTQSGTRGGEQRSLRRFQELYVHEYSYIDEDVWLDSDVGLWYTLAPRADWDPDQAKKSKRYVPGLKDVIESPEPQATMTKRSRRSMRGHANTSTFRNWTDREDQAGRVHYTLILL